jgi:Zn-dependent protease with chaperone function
MAERVTARAALALGLFVGFYAIGLALVAGLLWLPCAQVSYSGQVFASGGLALVGAAYVAWALVPRRSKWVAPGPELTRASGPGVYALVEEVARAAVHPMPQSIYLVNGANAFAASRPRWFGLRGEPVVGIGLPLFAVLTRRELQAVVAHEFGHYVGGDVRLGPWVHRTFQAIAAALSRLDGSSVFLHLPFYAYGRLFLRLTGTASREQELRADALAARIAGADAIGGALVAVEHHDDSWGEYWRGVYVPAVNAGFLLPMLDGYRRYVAAAFPDGRLAKATERVAPAPEDTHPPLEARLLALRVSRRITRPAGGSTLDLLKDVGATEEAVLTPMLNDASVLSKLERVPWEEWRRRVAPAVWARAMGERLATLRTVDLAQLPSLLAADDEWWQRLHAGVNVFSAEARRRQLRIWLGHWVALSLLSRGFTVASEAGAEVRLERGDVQIAPFRWVDDLAIGRENKEEWLGVVARVAAAPREAPPNGTEAAAS